MHVVHDGQVNTYTLTKERVKNKFKSLNEKEENVCSAVEICFVDGKEFLKGMKHKHMCFVIFPKDSTKEVEEVPVEVADVDENFRSSHSEDIERG